MRRVSSLLVSAVLSLSAWPVVAQHAQIHPLPEQKRLVPLTIGAHALTAADAQGWLNRMMPAQTDADAVTVVVIVKDGQVVLAEGRGRAGTAKDKPVDAATTLFRVGQVSAIFTWTAVMQLVQQGKLDLDADINAYLDFRIPPREGKPVTLRELMTQTAGFEQAAKLPADNGPATRIGIEAWVKRWVPRRIHPPGEVTASSRYGVALAGYIVQRTSGQSFDDYVEQHIFQPLGMRHASFRQPLPPSLVADLAGGHAAADASAKQLLAAPAEGLAISGGDMARFMAAHLQDGGDAAILHAATAQQMHEFKHIVVPGLPPAGLGFAHLDRNGHDVLGGRGDTHRFHSVVALFMEQKVGLFVSTDAGAADAQALIASLSNGFTDRYFPALPQLPQPMLASARAHGALMAGRYLPSTVSASNIRSMRNPWLQTTISMNSDGTLATPGFVPGARPARWREVKPFVWLDDASGSHLGAAVRGGEVRWMTLDALAPIVVFLPVPAWRSAGWNLPLLYAALAVFGLTTLLWAVAALKRRVRGEPPALHGSARRWYRWSRVAAMLHLLFALAGGAVLHRFNAGIAPSDASLRLFQGIGVLAIVGIVAVVANAWCAWHAPGRWWRKTNSTALVLACCATIWFVCSLHLLTPHLNY
jgi:CubicO group peptidase (beta-lactamase class C family)